MTSKSATKASMHDVGTDEFAPPGGFYQRYLYKQPPASGRGLVVETAVSMVGVTMSLAECTPFNCAT